LFGAVLDQMDVPTNYKHKHLRYQLAQYIVQNAHVVWQNYAELIHTIWKCSLKRFVLKLLNETQPCDLIVYHILCDMLQVRKYIVAS
jgi:hypothetical protein